MPVRIMELKKPRLRAVASVAIGRYVSRCRVRRLRVLLLEQFDDLLDLFRTAVVGMAVRHGLLLGGDRPIVDVRRHRAISTNVCFAGANRAGPDVADGEPHVAALVHRLLQGIVPRAVVAKRIAVEPQDHIAAFEPHPLCEAAPADVRDPFAEAVDVEAAKAELRQFVATVAGDERGLQVQGLRVVGGGRGNNRQRQSGQEGEGRVASEGVHDQVSFWGLAGVIWSEGFWRVVRTEKKEKQRACHGPGREKGRYMKSA